MRCDRACFFFSSDALVWLPIQNRLRICRRQRIARAAPAALILGKNSARDQVEDVAQRCVLRTFRDGGPFG